MAREEQSTAGDANRNPDGQTGPLYRLRQALFPGLTWGHVGYILLALATVLWAARAFYGPLQSQLFFAQATQEGAPTSVLWVSPDENVYHNFNLSRSTARGFFWHWSEGKGYAPQGAGHLYPLLLALGYRIGFTGNALMFWAAQLACLSLFVGLIAAKSLANGLHRSVPFLFPLALLGVGQQASAYFSGSSSSLFLLIWLCCAWLWQRLTKQKLEQRTLTATGLGLACALLIATNTNAIALAVLFVLGGVLACRLRGVPLRWQEFLALAIPVLTTAAGTTLLSALFETSTQQATPLAASLGAIHSAFGDVTIPFLGVKLQTAWLVWTLAIVPLFYRSARTSGLLLWSSLTVWVGLGEAIWPSNSTALPAIAWLCLLASLGIGLLASDALQSGADSVTTWTKRATLQLVAAIVCLGTLLVSQRAPFAQARWAFMNGGHEIYVRSLEQGRVLRNLPGATSIAVAEPGSLVYATDLPAVDLSGQGSSDQLPFEQAAALGAGGTLELLQQLPDSSRPALSITRAEQFADVNYSFGRQLLRIPTSSNTLQDLVVHRFSWAGLKGTDTPVERRSMDRVMGRVDFANLVSERKANVRLGATSLRVHSKLLPHPNNRQRQLWDAGRELSNGESTHVSLRGAAPQQKGRLVIRLAPHRQARLQVSSGKHELKVLNLSPTTSWKEVSLPLPLFVVAEPTKLTLRAEGGPVIVYSLWLLQRRSTQKQ